MTRPAAPYYESDGGPWWDGDVKVSAPTTHYVIDPRLDPFDDDDYRRDFPTKRAALAHLAGTRGR